LPKNIPYREIVRNTEMISLGYDVNDHACSSQNLSYFVRKYQIAKWYGFWH